MLCFEKTDMSLTTELLANTRSENLDSFSVESTNLIPLGFSDRKFILGVVDFLALNTALYASIFICLPPDQPGSQFVWNLTENPLRWQTGGNPIVWSLLLVTIWSIVGVSLGAYEWRSTDDKKHSVLAATKSVIVTSVLFVLVPYVTPLSTSVSLVLVFLGCALVLIIGARALSLSVLSYPRFQRRTLIVGAGQAGKALVKELVGVRQYRVLGFVDDNSEELGFKVRILERTDLSNGSPRGAAVEFPVLGDRHSLRHLIVQHQISTLVVAGTHVYDGQLLSVVMECREIGVEIVPMPVLYEELTGRVPVEHVGNHWSLAIPSTHPGTDQIFRLVKRSMDIVLAVLGLLCLAPFFPFIAAVIYLDSPGPIFYGQERVGKGSRRFRMWKFRSMVQNAEDGGAVWARDKDPRTTRVGRFLRATHIDEFPQFWNILKGDMSVVGPRPERPEFVVELEKIIPLYWLRHVVKPGMAGWGLVRQGYGGSDTDALLKLEYDLYYIKHQSSFFDVVILLKTVIDTVAFRGR